MTPALSEAPPGPARERAAAERLWLLLIALLVVLPRVLLLDADPPGDLHVHFITDEGWWAHNARLKVLFGHWIMDDHNPPLFSSPLYTFVLWLVYRVMGAGLYSTRLVSGLAGIATCVAVYAFVRREAGRAAASATALLLATNYFLLTNNRVGFVESLQLAFAAVAVLAAVRSRERPLWGPVSGLTFLAAFLCKPSAFPVALVIGAWYLLLLVEPGRSAAERGVRWRAALGCVGAVLVGAAAVGICFVLPHWEGVRTEFMSNVLIATSSTQRLGGVMSRLVWFGYRDEPGLDRFVLSGLFVQEAALVWAVGLLALRRLLRFTPGPASALERCCWLWVVVMLASMAAQSYQPDRRYLLLVPPLAILLALAARERPSAETGTPRPPTAGWRWLAASSVTGLLVGLYARGFLLPRLDAMTERWNVGKEAGFEDRTLLLAIWLMSFAAAAIAMAALRAWAAARAKAPGRTASRRPALRWGFVLLAVVVVIDVTRLAPVLGHLRFTIRDTSRAIGELAGWLPPARRVVVGNTSDTLSLESRMFAFLIREWAGVGMYMNRDGMTRFHPGLAVITERRGQPAGNDEGFTTQGMRVVGEFHYWPDDHGRPRLRTTVYAAADLASRIESRPH